MIKPKRSSDRPTQTAFKRAAAAAAAAALVGLMCCGEGFAQTQPPSSGNLDLDVAHGNIEFVKDCLVPALWTSASSGNWKDIANWNSGETPVAPVQGPGRVARVGAMVLPTPRMPGSDDAATGVLGANDTVNLNRPSEDITVTIDSTTPAIGIRRLNLNERLSVTSTTSPNFSTATNTKARPSPRSNPRSRRPMA